MLIAVFIVYLLLIAAIVVFSALRIKTNADFVLGGKKIPGMFLALSERATGESAWLLLGLTGIAYSEGWKAAWVVLGCVTGILFLWIFMAEPLRRITEKTGALTVSGLLFRSFPGSEKKIGLLSSVIIIFFFTLYLAAQFSGSGKIFNDTFKIDPFWGMVIGSAIVIIYSVIGGFITVVAVDSFQAVLMVITCVALPILALFVAATTGIGFAEMLLHADFAGKEMTGTLTTGTGFLLVMNGLSWAFGYTGQPQLLNRMMAMRNPEENRQARIIAIIWTFMAYGGAFLTGIIGYRLVLAGVIGENAALIAADAEKVMPVMVMTLLNPLLAGILLSGAVSAMMSTASSQVIVVSASITEDIWSNLRRQPMPERQRLFLNKFLTFMAGLVAFVMALMMKESVYGLVSYAWSGIGASFGPAMVLLLFWKRFSRAGVFASLITGTLSAVIWKTWLADFTGISERLASYIIASGMAVFFSLIFPENGRAKTGSPDPSDLPCPRENNSIKNDGTGMIH
jgi:sodium/proline symporter